MTSDYNSGSRPVGRSGRSDTPGDDRTYKEDTTYQDDRAYADDDSSRRASDPRLGGSHTESRAVGTTTRHDDDSRPVNVAVGAERHDGVRWGPVWAGLLTALTTFLLLELAFYAFGAIDLAGGGGDNSGWITGILALVSFFIGGLVAGATSLWDGLFSGLLHGFLVWALSVIAFIALTFFGAGALLGSFGELTSQLGVGPQDVQSATELSDAEAEQAAQDTQDAAGPAFWGLLLPLLAAMLGGLLGAKMWPRKKDDDHETVHMRN